MPKPIHYPQTSVEQRMQLFNVWEATNNVSTACATLKLSRATFYYWKAAFVNGGYRALDADQPIPDAQPISVSTHIAEEILALKAANPTWSKWQILRTLKLTHPFDEQVDVDTVAHVLCTTVQM